MKLKEGLLIKILTLITVASLGTSAYMVFIYEKPVEIMPDFRPVEQDVNVTAIKDDYVPLTQGDMDQTDASEEQSTGKRSSLIICGRDVVVHLEDAKIDMMYQNPQSSDAAIVLQLFIGDTLISQSGSISPGYQLREMQLLEKISLQPGGYNGVLKIGLYNVDTNEKAMVQTEVAVSITVE